MEKVKTGYLTHRNQLPLLLNYLGLDGIGCEIGVAFGENAEVILENSDLKRLVLIDPWVEQPKDIFPGGDVIQDYHGCYCYCHGKLARFKDRISVLRMFSNDAVLKFPDNYFDFIYIDGNHASPQIDYDILLWWPKLKTGGVFAGHDYLNFNDGNYRCDVKRVVDKFVSENNLQLFITEESEPSWYIIK